MKLKELLKNVEDVELTEEQEKQIKDYLGIKDSKKWKPERNESYFFVDNKGMIDKVLGAQPRCEDYQFRILTNNYFKTKEEAEFRLEQIKVYYELKNFADENNDEFDWTNQEQFKYYMDYSYSKNKLSLHVWQTIRDIGQIYFSSRELVKQAVEKVGEDRIKKYLFGVK